MKLKNYEICIEKDVDIITQAQMVVALTTNGWEVFATDCNNPTILTFYKWVDIQCDNIEAYTNAINNADCTLRIVDVINKEEV